MTTPSPIARRLVLFIPGFDPAPPRAHRERYRREGAAQAEISGYTLKISADPGTDPAAWQAVGCVAGQETHARIEVLGWADLVRDAMSGGPLASYRQLARTAAIYLGSGALFRLMRLRKGPVIAALYPVVMLLLQLAVGLALGAAVVAVILTGSGLALTPLTALLGLCTVAALTGLVLRWFKARDGTFLAHYLMQDYAYSAALRGAYPPALSERLARFTDRVVEAAGSDVDEVLIVGHSSGAYLGVSVLADALRSGRLPEGVPVSLLTLGQVVPMVSFLPDATRLRGDLATVAASARITWVDVTAPGDGCAFALCDPVSVTGVAPAGKRWPLVLSAAFTQTLSPERWQALRWRFFRLHFQYLCAFDRPGDYDYFAITAGPVSLAERFAGRAPSASRIETVVNRHTDRVA